MRILSFGSIYLDINLFDFPNHIQQLEFENEYIGSNYEFALGGSALIFSLISKSLELEPTFIGKVGEDDSSRLIRQLLENKAIKHNLITSQANQTNISFNITKSNGENLQIVGGNANPALLGEELLTAIDNVIDSVDLIYFGGVLKMKMLFEIYPQIVNIAKSKNIRVAVDHGRVSSQTSGQDLEFIQNLVNSLSQEDIYFPSKQEFTQVWGYNDLESGIKEFGKTHSVTIALKAGQAGSFSLTDGELIYQKGLEIIVKNTVGAGDTFNAGFIKATSLGLEGKERLGFANAAAAIKISTNTFPTVPAIEQLLKESK